MLQVSSSWKSRLKASGIHLIISLAIALAAALLVFFLWYPYPYSELAGGRSLFLLVIAVDVVMGPLLTLTVFNTAKPRSELVRDLSLIGLLQFTALVYGLSTVMQARPVHLAFEIDRYRVVSAVDVPAEFLDRAPPELRRLPLTGPTLLSIRPFKDANENFDATMAALAGAPLGARPDLWQSYEKAKPQILAAGKPLADLKARFPGRVAEIDAALKSQAPASGLPAKIAYVPLAARDSFWTVLINAETAEVIAFVPIDPY